MSLAKLARSWKSAWLALSPASDCKPCIRANSRLDRPGDRVRSVWANLSGCLAASSYIAARRVGLLDGFQPPVNVRRRGDSFDPSGPVPPDVSTPTPATL